MVMPGSAPTRALSQPKTASSLLPRGLPHAKASTPPVHLLSRWAASCTVSGAPTPWFRLDVTSGMPSCK